MYRDKEFHKVVKLLLEVDGDQRVETAMQLLTLNRYLPLRVRCNSYNEEIVVDFLTLEETGELFICKVCRNSKEYGFGLCNCNSHPDILEVPVNEDRARELIYNLLIKDLSSK